MKQHLFIFSLLILPGSLLGQTGISGAYKTFVANGWYDHLRQENAVNVGTMNGYAVGIDYWFRLPKKRIEFLPQLSYEKYSKSIAGTGDYGHEVLGFYFNTNIYPFDFGSDCDCPTWSKEGNLLAKGFFFQLSPGAWYLKNSLTPAQQAVKEGNYTWTLGAGIGLDLGLAEFLSLTPMVKFYYSPGNTWSIPDVKGEPVVVESAVQQIFAGLRLGFRWKQQGGKSRH